MRERAGGGAMSGQIPWLCCPVCAAGAFGPDPCTDCGGEECLCDGTGWVYYDTGWTVCVCGTALRVQCDDGVASVDYDEDGRPVRALPEAVR